MPENSKKPAILFVCSKNGGKSQLAAALLQQLAGDTMTVLSAGTTPGTALNAETVESLAELGIDISHEHPKPVTEAAIDAVDTVVILGTEAKLAPREGKHFEVWETDEPSRRGIHGMERMRLVRDDIRARVGALYAALSQQHGAPSAEPADAPG